MPTPPTPPKPAETQEVKSESELGQLQSKVNDMANQLRFFASKGGDEKDTKRTEKVNYLIAQIEGINSRLEGLERAIDLGVPIARARESVDKLDTLTKNADAITGKMTGFVLESKDLEKKLSELEALVAQRASSDQIEALSERITYLEKLLNDLKSPKSRAILTDIVSIEESLGNRVANLENSLSEITNMPEGVNVNLAETVKVKEKDKEGKKKGFFDSLGGFFDGIMGGLNGR